MTNPYEIGEEIFDNAIVLGRFGGEGKSGFGAVYLVAEKNTGLALAMKTLQKENISITSTPLPPIIMSQITFVKQALPTYRCISIL